MYIEVAIFYFIGSLLNYFFNELFIMCSFAFFLSRLLVYCYDKFTTVNVNDMTNSLTKRCGAYKRVALISNCKFSFS